MDKKSTDGRVEKMIEQMEWGTLPDGKTASLYTITRGTTTLTASDYGCIITSLLVPDKNGKQGNIVLGYDSLDEYCRDNAYLGAAIGRYANRIGCAAFRLNGVRYELTANEGENTLHGGAGFHKRLWEVETDEYSITFRRISPDGEDGFPGELKVLVQYAIQEDGALRITYEAEAAQDTVLCLTNHSYFNLNGGGTIQDHNLFLAAGHYTPVDKTNIPTGELRPTEGTDFDFCTMRPIGTFPYDHNFALDKTEGRMAELYAPKSGRRITLTTDMPGVQLYTGCCLSPRRGRNGEEYGPGMSVCLETQHFPDSPNKPEFPSPLLKAGEHFKSQTVFGFDTVDNEAQKHLL